MKKQNFTREEVIELLSDLLEMPDILESAIKDENTDWTAESILALFDDHIYKSNKGARELSNEAKAKMIADQCRPCSKDFYSGIMQGVLIALNTESKKG